MIKLFGVTKIYPNGVTGLKNLSLRIRKGEFVFIIGESGSGKSTLFKLLLHEETPTKGELHVYGYKIPCMPRSEIPYLRRSIGVVFQDFRLLPNKTAYENVAFAMQIVDAPPRSIQKQVPLVLELVGLTNKASAYPSQLSGGEQQRVAIARALVNNPPILIADEPTGNLDPKTSWEIMNLLDEINQRGTTVIVATHEKVIVDGMKKRVMALEHGVLKSNEQKGLYLHED